MPFEYVKCSCLYCFEAKLMCGEFAHFIRTIFELGSFSLSIMHG